MNSSEIPPTRACIEAESAAELPQTATWHDAEKQSLISQKNASERERECVCVCVWWGGGGGGYVYVLTC